MRKQYTSQGTKYWVKQGAHVEETEAQLDILEAASEAYSGTDQKLVVTSGDEGYRGDGVHSWGSHHYPENTPKGRGGWALDLRIWGLDNPQKTADEIASILGVDFDVVYGPSHGTHIHVEYDP